MGVVIGWDIGGVHLKAARVADGRVVDAVQIASPLRLGFARLAEAFAEAKARLGAADMHAVTMTGELADRFASRAEGVAALTAAALRELAPAAVRLYAGRAGFRAPEAAAQHVTDIASANWFASASVVAGAIPAALFVDMGSTTTDIIPVRGGKVAAHGYTDAERLATGELVYTGLVRTPLMALAARAPFAGHVTRLVAEPFATMADVHRILGTLPETADQMATMDGREKTVAASQARLARMVGRDAADGDAAAWRALAQWFAEAQLGAVTDGLMQVLSDGALPAAAPLVLAGVGAGVLREAARRLGRDCVGFDRVLGIAPGVDAAAYAPAAAVAILAGRADAGVSGSGDNL